jgi:hypothetical protein
LPSESSTTRLRQRNNRQYTTKGNTAVRTPVNVKTDNIQPVYHQKATAKANTAVRASVNVKTDNIPPVYHQRPAKACAVARAPVDVKTEHR